MRVLCDWFHRLLDPNVMLTLMGEQMLERIIAG